MRTFDFSPLYRSTVGFDHISSLLDAVNRNDLNSGYPPYNIELLDKDQYQITMAVAGFVEDELDLQIEQQMLKVRGTKSDDDGETQRNYLHQGIAARNFERRFQLADHVEVKSAKLANGLLHINLAREIPEAMKPRQIPITSAKGKLIDVDKKQEAA